MLVIALFFVAACKVQVSEPEIVCGNEILEAGENAQTCCLDAGCPEGQSCENNVCKEIVCGEDEYLENNECKKFECMDNKDCQDNERCVVNICTGLVCPPTQYIEDHRCKDYVCLEDSDCDDNDKETKDTCMGEKERWCENEKVYECEDKDGACPKGCHPEIDDDCKEYMTDCKEDLNCFIDKIEGDCRGSLASVTQKSNYNPLTGATDDTEIEIYRELRGKARSSCKYYHRIEKMDIETDDSTIRAAFKAMQGRENECKSKAENLKEALSQDNPLTEEELGFSCSNAGDIITGPGIYGPEQIDCGNNMDCFAKLGPSCTRAKMVQHYDEHPFAAFLGVIQVTDTFMQINPSGTDTCRFYQRYDRNDVSYSDELVQNLLDAGNTQEEIDQMEQTAQQQAQDLVGTSVTCIFENNDLADLLQRWNNGEMSTSDLSGAECS